MDPNRGGEWRNEVAFQSLCKTNPVTDPKSSTSIDIMDISGNHRVVPSSLPPTPCQLAGIKGVRSTCVDKHQPAPQPVAICFEKLKNSCGWHSPITLLDALRAGSPLGDSAAARKFVSRVRQDTDLSAAPGLKSPQAM